MLHPDPMRPGVLFVILGVALGGLGAIEGGYASALLWPALSFLVVGAGYLGLGGLRQGADVALCCAGGVRPVVCYHDCLAAIGFQVLRKEHHSHVVAAL